ncbi:unnamed protein product [Colias eurytheme]|nr:unnamed protein product [Colias eurytheme]
MCQTQVFRAGGECDYSLPPEDRTALYLCTRYELLKKETTDQDLGTEKILDIVEKAVSALICAKLKCQLSALSPAATSRRAGSQQGATNCVGRDWGQTIKHLTLADENTIIQRCEVNLLRHAASVLFLSTSTVPDSSMHSTVSTEHQGYLQPTDHPPQSRLTSAVDNRKSANQHQT